MEKADGKQTNFELSFLRVGDQEYVCSWLESAYSDQELSTPMIRLWRFADGEEKIIAKFVSAWGYTVSLQRLNGTIMRAELSKLSSKDQEYVNQRLAAEKKSE